MQIEFDIDFEENLKSILEYIAKDKLSASKRFRKELFKQIKRLTLSPYQCRKSIYFNDENVRDLIFKGYTIVYEVDLKNNKIIIFKIFNQNKPPNS